MKQNPEPFPPSSKVTRLSSTNKTKAQPRLEPGFDLTRIPREQLRVGPDSLRAGSSRRECFLLVARTPNFSARTSVNLWRPCNWHSCSLRHSLPSAFWIYRSKDARECEIRRESRSWRRCSEACGKIREEKKNTTFTSMTEGVKIPPHAQTCFRRTCQNSAWKLSPTFSSMIPGPSFHSTGTLLVICAGSFFLNKPRYTPSGCQNERERAWVTAIHFTSSIKPRHLNSQIEMSSISFNTFFLPHHWLLPECLFFF